MVDYIGHLSVDVIGLATLFGILLCVIAYFLWCQALKLRNGRGHSRIAAGMFRLAAARGDLHSMACLTAVETFDVNAALAGFTALHAACVQGQQDAATWLCVHGANVHATKDDGWQETGLHYAAARGFKSIVMLLLAFDADTTAKNYSGATPADLAAKAGHSELAEYLQAVTAGDQPRPSLIPYQQFASQLDAALTEYCNSTAASIALNSIDAYSNKHTEVRPVELTYPGFKLLPNLLQPQQLMPHRGGQHAEPDSTWYSLLRWGHRSNKVHTEAATSASSSSEGSMASAPAEPLPSGKLASKPVLNSPTSPGQQLLAFDQPEHQQEEPTANEHQNYKPEPFQQSTDCSLFSPRAEPHRLTPINSPRVLTISVVPDQFKSSNSHASTISLSLQNKGSHLLDQATGSTAAQMNSISQTAAEAAKAAIALAGSDSWVIKAGPIAEAVEEETAESVPNKPHEGGSDHDIDNPAGHTSSDDGDAMLMFDGTAASQQMYPAGNAFLGAASSRLPASLQPRSDVKYSSMDAPHASANRTEPDTNHYNLPNSIPDYPDPPSPAELHPTAPADHIFVEKLLHEQHQGVGSTSANQRNKIDRSRQAGLSAPSGPGRHSIGTTYAQLDLQTTALRPHSVHHSLDQEDGSPVLECVLQQVHDSQPAATSTDPVSYRAQLHPLHEPDSLSQPQQTQQGTAPRSASAAGLKEAAQLDPAAADFQGSSPEGSEHDHPQSERRTLHALQLKTSVRSQQESTSTLASQSASPATLPWSLHPDVAAKLRILISDKALRAFEGLGTQGACLVRSAKHAQPLMKASLALSAVYIIWRSCRSCVPGWLYLYSLPVLAAEAVMVLMGVLFMLGVWNQLERQDRWLGDMLLPGDFPTVDVYVVCYTEPPEVVEATVIAAMNLNYPGSRLAIHVLDDGNSPALKNMVARLQYQAKYMHREAQLIYIARQKVEGVPHHAKAGNINSAMLKESPGNGEYILVLDCDMILHPDFLLQTLGHFYRWVPAEDHGSQSTSDLDPYGLPVDLFQDDADDEGGGSDTAPRGRWVLKEKAAFIQTPQDFWNVAAEDPLVHFARFFYGPMLQGRDGIGACPCCGTGVVFRRDILVSIGGQAYGSITEDYNTAMTLLGAGFATMFLNKRMAFGQAPDDLAGVFKQRLRWAMGAMQILMRDNPLLRPGLTLTQSMLFWEAAAHHFMAPITLLLAFLPIIYIFVEVSPVNAENLWEFTIVFCSYFLVHRITMWQLHKACIGAGQELWRGSQMSITFVVTSKKPANESAGNGLSREELWDTITYNGPFLVFYVTTLAALVYLIVMAGMGHYNLWTGAIAGASGGWVLMTCLCMWPPVSTLLPREETDFGWRIRWDLFLPIPQPLQKAASTAVDALSRASLLLGRRLSSSQNSSNMTAALALQSPRGIHTSGHAGQPSVVDDELAPPSILSIGATAQRRKSLLGMPMSPMAFEAAQHQRRHSMLLQSEAAGGMRRARRGSMLLPSPLGAANRHRRASLQILTFTGLGGDASGWRNGLLPPMAGGGQRNRRGSLLGPLSVVTAAGSHQYTAGGGRPRRASLLVPSVLQAQISDIRLDEQDYGSASPRYVSGAAAQPVAGVAKTAQGSALGSTAVVQATTAQGPTAVAGRPRRASLLAPMDATATAVISIAPKGQGYGGVAQKQQKAEQEQLHKQGNQQQQQPFAVQAGVKLGDWGGNPLQYSHLLVPAFPLTGCSEVDSAVMASTYGYDSEFPGYIEHSDGQPQAADAESAVRLVPIRHGSAILIDDLDDPMVLTAEAASSPAPAKHMPSKMQATLPVEHGAHTIAAVQAAANPADMHAAAVKASGSSALNLPEKTKGQGLLSSTDTGLASSAIGAFYGNSTDETYETVQTAHKQQGHQNKPPSGGFWSHTATVMPAASQQAVQPQSQLFVKAGNLEAAAAAAAVPIGQRFENHNKFGKIGLPMHSRLAHTSSALLTGLVLPERPLFSNLRSAAGVYRTNSISAFLQQNTNAPGGSMVGAGAAVNTGPSNALQGPTRTNDMSVVAATGRRSTAVGNRIDSFRSPRPPQPQQQQQPAAPSTVDILDSSAFSLSLPPSSFYTNSGSQQETAPAGGVPKLKLNSNAANGNVVQSPRPCAADPYSRQLDHYETQGLRGKGRPGRRSSLALQADQLNSPHKQGGMYGGLGRARRGSIGPLLVIGPNGEFGAAPVTAGVSLATGGSTGSFHASLRELVPTGATSESSQGSPLPSSRLSAVPVANTQATNLEQHGHQPPQPTSANPVLQQEEQILGVDADLLAAETSVDLLPPTAVLRLDYDVAKGSRAAASAAQAHQAIAGLAGVLSSALATAAINTPRAQQQGVSQSEVADVSMPQPSAGAHVQRLISAEIDSSNHSAAGYEVPGLRTAAATDHADQSVLALPASLHAASPAATLVMHQASQEAVENSLAADDESMLLVVPTEPATIFEATIASRPNFDDRQLPPSNYWYLIIYGLILVVLVCGAVVEVATGRHLY